MSIKVERNYLEINNWNIEREFWIREILPIIATDYKEINNSMPSIPITIMKPEEIVNFENDLNHPLRVALQENDLWDWLPQSPLYIFHGEGDELVPFENAQIAYNQFIENGVENVFLEAIPESFGGHQDVAPWALFGAYQIAAEIQLINNLGDVNQDGELNIFDIIKIVNIILNGSDIYYELCASDLNSDQDFNILDVIILVDSILEY